MRFPSPVEGRYFEIKSVNAHDDKPHAGSAGLELLDAIGRPLGPENWKIASVDSEETEIDPAAVTHRLDGFGGGVLFYDIQFDIAATAELYDWCFADVKTSFLHLLIRPECEPENDNDDGRSLDKGRFDFGSAARPLRIAREALKRNPGLQIYASVYSPPPCMKSNGSTRGDAPLKDGPAVRRELAEFVYGWVRHARAEVVISAPPYSLVTVTTGERPW